MAYGYDPPRLEKDVFSQPKRKAPEKNLVKFTKGTIIPMGRKIIHIDMDAFFASVEQRDRPELRGKPVMVGGSPEGRGVVAAASYEAREFGIHSAMPAYRAHKLCPQGIFVRPRFEVYQKVSREIRAIFKSYTDLIEPLSLDEAFLDVTENKKNVPSATWIAADIRHRIFKETKLTASGGVAPNKFLAKIASEVNKPNGLFVIEPDRAQEFVANLPIGRFYSIGRATEKKMHKLGIFSGGDLAARSQEELVRHFGKMGYFYHDIARGRDDRDVRPHRQRKSAGVEQTFATDIHSWFHMERELSSLSQRLFSRLVKAGIQGRTMTLKVRYPDFQTLTRRQTEDIPATSPEELLQRAIYLLKKTQAREKGIRLLGISVSNFKRHQIHVEAIQLLLPFSEMSDP